MSRFFECELLVTFRRPFLLGFNEPGHQLRTEPTQGAELEGGQLIEGQQREKGRGRVGGGKEDEGKGRRAGAGWREA